MAFLSKLFLSVAIYYNVVMAYSIIYLGVSFRGITDPLGMPWSYCGEWWGADENCVTRFGVCLISHLTSFSYTRFTFSFPIFPQYLFTTLHSFFMFLLFLFFFLYNFSFIFFHSFLFLFSVSVSVSFFPHSPSLSYFPFSFYVSQKR